MLGIFFYGSLIAAKDEEKEEKNIYLDGQMIMYDVQHIRLCHILVFEIFPSHTNLIKISFLPKMSSNLDLSLSNKMIFERSLKNCHVVGLHGIVFQEKDNFLTRMFVTTPDHVLHQNQCNESSEGWQPLSLAIHPHRIDIEIHVVSGEIWNMEFEKVSEQEQSISFLKSYKWSSHIMRSDKPGGFEEVEASGIKLKNKRKMVAGDRLKMRTDQMHTVFVEKGATASWFIYQSQPTGEYDGITYSNHDLTQWTAKGLYEKPSKEEVLDWLKIAEITFN